MSYYEKEYKRRLSLNQDGNALVMLIAINLVIFVLFTFVKVFYYFSYEQPAADINFGNDIYSNLALPASLHELERLSLFISMVRWQEPLPLSWLFT